MIFTLIKTSLIVMLGVEQKTIRVFHRKNKVWKEIGFFTVFVDTDKYYRSGYYELEEHISEVLHHMKNDDHLHKVKAVTDDGKVISYNESKLSEYVKSRANIF